MKFNVIGGSESLISGTFICSLLYIFASDWSSCSPVERWESRREEILAREDYSLGCADGW